MESKLKTGFIPVRPILALTISLVVCCLVGGYQWFVLTLPKRDVTEFVTTAATGDYSMDVTLSFEAQGDAFDPTALLIRLDGKDLLNTTEPIAAGIPLKIRPVEGLIVGLNEFFIQVGTGEQQNASGSTQPDPFAEAGFEKANPSVDRPGFPAERVETSEPIAVKAVRFRVFEGEVVLVEKTVWSEPGETISSSIVIDIPGNGTAADTPNTHSDHDH